MKSVTCVAAKLMAVGVLGMIGMQGVAVQSSANEAQPAQSSKEDKPGLRVGEKAPDAVVKDAKGETVRLAEVFAEGPTVLIFYRGAWCPYCTRSLADWQKSLDDFEAAGAQIVAISPERVEGLSQTEKKSKAKYTLLSDTSLQAAERYRLVFGLDDATQSRYKGYGIDLARHNASGEWRLPAPATFVIGTDGIVKYAWAQWDYSTRVGPEDALKTVQSLAP